MFFIIFISFVGFFAFYAARQLLRPAKPSRLKKYTIISAFVFVVFAAPITIFCRRFGVENIGVDIMAWAGYTGLGFMSFLVSLLMIRDILRLIIYILKKIYKKTPLSLDITHISNPGRRRFLLNSVNTGILASAGIFTGYGMVRARQIPDVKKIPILIKDLPSDLDGFRIVQITDIHVSPTIKKGFVKNVVNVVNTLSPDVVVLTGDLVDGSVTYLADDVDPLKEIKSTYGNFFVTGNHEYYSGVKPWIEKIRALGFTVLLNENRIISQGRGKILMAGVTDFQGGRFFSGHQPDIEKAMYCAAFTHVKILLAHQPKDIIAAAKAGVDLQISGHTHGGQFYPWHLLVRMSHPFLKGLHQYNACKIYVSSGTGYWGPPIRFGSPSEITLITLHGHKPVNSTNLIL